MRSFIEGLSQEKLIALKLDHTDAIFIQWAKSLFASPKAEKKIDAENNVWYWIKYTKILSDLPILFTHIKTVRRYIQKITANKNVLEQKLFRTQKGTYTYFRFTKNILDILEGSEDMKSLVTGDEIKTQKTNEKDYHKRKVQKNCLEIFEALKEIKHNGVTIFTNHTSPADDHHYNATYKKFQDTMCLIYEGRFLTEYPMTQFEPWFLKKYKYYLDEEKIIKGIKKCKGSWEEIKKMMLLAGFNYSKWFDPINENKNKEKLPKGINEWLFFQHSNISMFYLCLIKKPTVAREASADDIFNSIPLSLRNIASRLYSDEFDSFIFWNKIKKLITWYETNAISLCEKDSNCIYWLGFSTSEFLKKYIEWINELTERKPYLNNIGIGNKTWAFFCADARSQHNITCMIK